MTIIAVRHAPTAWNQESIIIGHEDIGLAPEAADTISRIAQALRKHPFSLILTSDLRRAKETAEKLGAAGVDAPIREDARLREVDYGEHTAEKKQAVRDEEPRYHNDPSYVHPDGESFKQMQARVVECVEEHAKKHDDLLVVTHAGCLRALKAHYLREPFKEHINTKWAHEDILFIHDGEVFTKTV